MILRKAVDADIPELRRLLFQVGDVHHQIRPDLFRPGAIKYTESELADLLKDEDFPIFAAMEGESMLGYCFCQWRVFQNSTALTDRKELYIDDLCVDEKFRGRGIASELYEHTCAFARQIGCHFITLNVWSGNDGAMKFYERAGLRPRSVTMDMPLEGN